MTSHGSASNSALERTRFARRSPRSVGRTTLSDEAIRHGHGSCVGYVSRRHVIGSRRRFWRRVPCRLLRHKSSIVCDRQPSSETWPASASSWFASSNGALVVTPMQTRTRASFARWLASLGKDATSSIRLTVGVSNTSSKVIEARSVLARRENIDRDSLRCKPLGPGHACVR